MDFECISINKLLSTPIKQKSNFSLQKSTTTTNNPLDFVLHHSNSVNLDAFYAMQKLQGQLDKIKAEKISQSKYSAENPRDTTKNQSNLNKSKFLNENGDYFSDSLKDSKGLFFRGSKNKPQGKIKKNTSLKLSKTAASRHINLTDLFQGAETLSDDAEDVLVETQPKTNNNSSKPTKLGVTSMAFHPSEKNRVNVTGRQQLDPAADHPTLKKDAPLNQNQSSTIFSDYGKPATDPNLIENQFNGDEIAKRKDIRESSSSQEKKMNGNMLGITQPISLKLEKIKLKKDPSVPARHFSTNYYLTDSISPRSTRMSFHSPLTERKSLRSSITPRAKLQNLTQTNGISVSS